MKVLMVLPFLKAGGTERQASYIVNYLHQRGYYVRTLCVEKTGPFGNLFKTSIHFLKSKNTNLRFLLNLILFLKFLQKNEFDIIISRAWSTNILSGFASMICKKPCVLFLSGSIDLTNHNPVKKIIFKFVLKKADKIIAVSKESRLNCIKWLNISPDKIDVVYNGVDIKLIEEMSNEEIELPDGLNKQFPTVSFVGSLVHRKGVDILINAMQEVISHENLNLIIVGDGELFNFLKDLRDDLGLKRNIFFIGEKINPFPYLKFSSIFVLPSRSEGFPNVLIEAMATNNAVIASDCPTGPNEIIDGNNGTLIPVNDFKSLAFQLNRYLKNRNLIDSLKKNALETVRKEFQLEEQMKKIEEILREKSRYQVR